MSYYNLEHPDIQAIQQCGYPHWLKHEKNDVYCGECGRKITGKIYEDEHYAYLCKECLLFLHERERWW